MPKNCLRLLLEDELLSAFMHELLSPYKSAEEYSSEISNSLVHFPDIICLPHLPTD